jgi:hypothetical protein
VSGIVFPHGVNAVEFVGTALGPPSDGSRLDLVLYGNRRAIQLDADNCGAHDANTYDGAQGVGLTIVALVYSGTATSNLDNGHGTYGTGTYGIQDWRGGRLTLHRAYIAGFQWGVWGIQSDETRSMRARSSAAT